MELTINGSPQETKADNVAELIAEMNLTGRRVAVMINDEIIKRDRFSATSLHAGDSIEIIHMVGGG